MRTNGTKFLFGRRSGYYGLSYIPAAFIALPYLADVKTSYFCQCRQSSTIGPTALHGDYNFKAEFYTKAARGSTRRKFGRSSGITIFIDLTAALHVLLISSRRSLDIFCQTPTAHKMNQNRDRRGFISFTTPLHRDDCQEICTVPVEPPFELMLTK